MDVHSYCVRYLIQTNSFCPYFFLEFFFRRRLEPLLVVGRDPAVGVGRLGLLSAFPDCSCGELLSVSRTGAVDLEGLCNSIEMIFCSVVSTWNTKIG